MKKLIVIGITLITLLSVTAGTSMAQSDQQKWGFKLNINLQNTLQPYVKIATDMLVEQYNKQNNSYQINTYNSELNGNFKMAYAMSKEGNHIAYISGEYTNASLAFNAQGTFPYSKNISQFINNTITSKNLNVTGNINIKDKHMANGSISQSSPGKIVDISTNSSTDMKIHFSGKNIPFSIILYSILKEKATIFNKLSIQVNLIYEKSLSNLTTICLMANINERWNDNPINSAIKINDIYSNNPYISLNIKDENHNGYFDTGDYLYIHLNTSYINDIIKNGGGIPLWIHINYHGLNKTAGLILYNSSTTGWSITSGFVYYVPSISPRYRDILNQTRDLPVYDNFNFTINMKYYDHTNIKYSPYLPLIPTKQENITMTTNGNYSGFIKITGLQQKYMKILESILNTTFPIYLQKLNTHINSFNFGTISYKTTFSIQSANITGTMEYGNEKVYVVNLGIPHKSNTLFESIKVYYFYSPSKKFVVGGGFEIGPKRFDTQATTYEDAQKEIKSIENSENSKPSTSSMNSWMIWIFVGISIIIIAAIVSLALKRRKS